VNLNLRGTPILNDHRLFRITAVTLLATAFFTVYAAGEKKALLSNRKIIHWDVDVYRILLAIEDVTKK
jgi:hypothetical protein